MSYFDHLNLKRADFLHWNHVAFVTLNEFIYLAAGFEPLHIGIHGNGYLNLSNEQMKEFYRKIKRLGDELPRKTTKLTEVKSPMTPEPKYEAVYLISWARSKGIKVHQNYNPIISENRKTINLVSDFLDRDVVSRNEFSTLLAICNPEKNENYFRLRLTEAMKVGMINPISGTQDLNAGIPLEDRNYEYSLKDLLDYASQKQWSLPEQLIVLSEPKKVKAPDPRLINSSEKLYLGLALELGYDPDNTKNTTTGSNRYGFSGILAKYGIELSDDTIRNLLKTASQKHLSSKPNKS
ncbi:TPA: hypothetical protein JBH02_13560 [Legionella pneumophila]|nr:hypothetical protein [Legionella pneumophila]